MRTTVEIPDALFQRAKRHARMVGLSMSALVADGLRLIVDARVAASTYRRPDRSVGIAGAPDLLEGMTWPALRDEIDGSGR
jgi:Arc/MetJ family transcription regulator